MSQVSCSRKSSFRTMVLYIGAKADPMERDMDMVFRPGLMAEGTRATGIQGSRTAEANSSTWRETSMMVTIECS